VRVVKVVIVMRTYADPLALSAPVVGGVLKVVQGGEVQDSGASSESPERGRVSDSGSSQGANTCLGIPCPQRLYSLVSDSRSSLNQGRFSFGRTVGVLAPEETANRGTRRPDLGEKISRNLIRI